MPVTSTLPVIVALLGSTRCSLIPLNQIADGLAALARIVPVARHPDAVVIRSELDRGLVERDGADPPPGRGVESDERLLVVGRRPEHLPGYRKGAGKVAAPHVERGAHEAMDRA